MAEENVQNNPGISAETPAETPAAAVEAAPAAIPDAPREKESFKNQGAMADAMARIKKLTEQHYSADSFHDDLKKNFTKQLKTAHDAWEDGAYTPPEGSDALRAFKKEQRAAKNTGLYISLGVGLAVGLALAAVPPLAFGVIAAAPGAAAASALVTNLALGASALTAIGGVVAGWFASEPVGKMMASRVKSAEPTLASIVTDDQKKDASIRIAQDRGSALADDIALYLKSKVADGSLQTKEAEAVLIYLSTATPDTLELQKPVKPEGEDIISFDAKKMQEVVLRNAREHHTLESLTGTYAQELNEAHKRKQAEDRKKDAKSDPDALREKDIKDKQAELAKKRLEDELAGTHKTALDQKDTEIRARDNTIQGQAIQIQTLTGQIETLKTLLAGAQEQAKTLANSVSRGRGNDSN